MYSYKEGSTIELKTSRELEAMRISNRIAADVLRSVLNEVKPGVSTLDLEKHGRVIIKKHQARSAFIGYRGYPAHTCISLNSEVVHGIPTAKRIVQEGDIVSVDVGIVFNGFYGDNAATVIAGNDINHQSKLVNVTKHALYAGIRKALPGNRLGDISAEIQRIAEENGFSVVRDFVGHGIGRNMHEEPQIPNYGTQGTGPRLEPGMVLALEPMINAGGFEVKTLQDGWTVVTVDGKNSAHWEHAIAVTDNEPEILTQLSV